MCVDYQKNKQTWVSNRLVLEYNTVIVIRNYHILFMYFLVM